MAGIFYSHAFQILWPEIFFPHSRSIEGKSSYATPAMIFMEKNRNNFSRTLPTAKIKIREKIITMFLRQNRENLATRKYPIIRYVSDPSHQAFTVRILHQDTCADHWRMNFL